MTQRSGLLWLMGKEIEENAEQEKFRAINMGLASNPNTSFKFIESLLDEPDTAEVIYEEEEEWQTPENIEQVEQLIQEYESRTQER